NTMQAVATLKAGEDTYRKTFGGGRNRWGDYSATCVDPSDDQTLWTIQEYARPHVGGACVDGSGRLSPWVGAVAIPCCPTINISPASLPGATIGVPYNQALTPSAGTPPFTFSLQSGTLPPQINLSPAGVISGTPSSTVGTFNFTVTCVDNAGCPGTPHPYSIAVVCSLPGDVNGDTFKNGDDIQHFVECLLNGTTTGGNCGCADMNADGIVNGVDQPLFENALLF